MKMTTKKATVKSTPAAKTAPKAGKGMPSFAKAGKSVAKVAGKAKPGGKRGC